MAVLALFCTINAGAQQKVTKDLSGFNKISFGVPGNLYVSFGKEYSVVIEAERDVLDDLITEVSSGRLVIKMENNFHFRTGNNHVTAHITMPAIEGLAVSGSGKAEITEQVADADKLDLNVSGSGKIVTADITADKLDCNISGSGNIEIGGSGSVDSGEITITGSGNFSGEQLEIDHLNVRVSGSGNCSCRAGDTLTAFISGSGNVTYSGDPRIDARVSGSGKVRSR